MKVQQDAFSPLILHLACQYCFAFLLPLPPEEDIGIGRGTVGADQLTLGNESLTFIKLHFYELVWVLCSPSLFTLAMGSCSFETTFIYGGGTFLLCPLFPRDKCLEGDLPFLLSHSLVTMCEEAQSSV